MTEGANQVGLPSIAETEAPAHSPLALAEDRPTPHLDDNGTCDCMCANCTVTVGFEMWRCICPDCAPVRCGGHGKGGFE